MTHRMGLTRLGPMLLALLAFSACDAPQARVPAGSRISSGDGMMASPVLGTPVRSGGQQQLSGGPIFTASSARPATTEATGAGAERAFVTAILTDLQGESFRVNSEHCGYIGLDGAGNLMQTQSLRGTEASCTLPQVPAGMTLLASYHTHGTYSPRYASEFPTSTDMLTDASDGIDGYISTPGGRLWYVDSDTMTVRELCGRGCLPQDPNYVAADDGPVRPLMSLRDLQNYEGSGAF
jgi:hypothetical protein